MKKTLLMFWKMFLIALIVGFLFLLFGFEAIGGGMLYFVGASVIPMLLLQAIVWIFFKENKK